MRVNNLWIVLFALLVVASCKKSEDDDPLVGDWAKIGDFDGAARHSASSFVIDGKAYIGFGYNAKTIALNDLWEYSGAGWKQIDTVKNNIRPSARYDATVLTIGKKAYFGLGYSNETKTYFKDFWEFDPITEKWKQLADFPSVARAKAVGVGLDGKAYVGTGTDGGSKYKDFYVFTPDAGEGKWEPIASNYAGSKREGAAIFILGNKFYLFGGENNSTAVNDFHSYDPSAPVEKRWTKLRTLSNATAETFDDDYGSLPRANASTFVINGLAYVATGDVVGTPTNVVYEYNPGNDTWVKRTGLETSRARTAAVGFSLNNRGFIATGKSAASQLDDFWEFFPTRTQDNSNN